MEETGFITEWYASYDLIELYSQLQPGYLLEFDYERRYFHWAVYVGEQYRDSILINHAIIHRTAPRNVISASFASVSNGGAGLIELTSIEDAMWIGKVRINNQLDNRYSVFPAETIIRRAMERLNSPENIPTAFNVMRNNCEHFANDCRYGQRISLQVDQQVEAIRGGANTIAVVLDLMAIFGNVVRGNNNHARNFSYVLAITANVIRRLASTNR